MKKSFFALLAFSSAVCFGNPAKATTVDGVEFTSFLIFDAPASGDLTLSTSHDIYVFAPDNIIASIFDLTAAVEIKLSQSVTADTISLCATAPICASLGPYAYDRDLVVNLLDPVDVFTLLAGGSIVVSPQPIPEPSTALLLALGLAMGGLRRRPTIKTVVG
jgi:hypothetical protein